MDERGFGPPPPPYLCEQERLSYIEKWGGGEEVMGDRSRQDPDWKGNLYAGVTTLRCCLVSGHSAAFLVSRVPGWVGREGGTCRAGRREAAIQSEDARQVHLDPHQRSLHGVPRLLPHPPLCL